MALRRKRRRRKTSSSQSVEQLHIFTKYKALQQQKGEEKETAQEPSSSQSVEQLHVFTKDKSLQHRNGEPGTTCNRGRHKWGCRFAQERKGGESAEPLSLQNTQVAGSAAGQNCAPSPTPHPADLEPTAAMHLQTAVMCLRMLGLRDHWPRCHRWPTRSCT